ncbi:metalloregulator ArsR/SmtB family transcription factor [Desulfovibrio mangrovi]|uniref:ArsR/SmtB family transcription factor n=1 Tax=Desulfovibrio mangrovi TaxID=2976983 RepID=UPI00224838F9|nr:metalloregulator ArsR/SmtB family transcription factor [Desulfovibrio mangrovi]UZP68673.1 metalloregulator ArsR/SmtB family transcription factor [Desulfovibrio mangrovi]
MNELDIFTRVTKAISDPGRVKILKMLEIREMCACEIVAALNLAQPTISKHLKQLVEAGLIVARREGSWIHFRLARREDMPDTAPGTGQDIRESTLAFLRQHLNGDPAIRILRQQLPELSPEKLQCNKG